ncbi:hypothetical protein ND00_04350 [Clostridium sp. L74]|nr:hypothetical protein ND00_04350 [Clostridium sp. L74]
MRRRQLNEYRVLKENVCLENPFQYSTGVWFFLFKFIIILKVFNLHE